MNPVRLFVDPKLIKAAQQMENPLLQVPEDAAQGRRDNRRWHERLMITEVSISPVLDKDTQKETDRIAVRARFKVSALSPCELNRGRNTSVRWLLNLTANEGTGDYIMTAISLSRMNALLRSCGYTPDGSEGIDYTEYFGPESELIGREINATVVDRPDRDDPAIRRQDLEGFTAVED